MPFTGKATYGAGPDLPELAEDVADIIGIVSPFETPLLDHLGDAAAPASSTIHEWVEDTLLPNSDQINQTVFVPNAFDATEITVDHGDRFQPGDLLQGAEFTEVMLVTAVAANILTVVRGYGGTAKQALTDNLKLNILGNAALEGADAPAARFTARTRKRNWTQIFTATVNVSGTMQSARTLNVADEVDYQKQERMRELLRDLENCVINGIAPAANQQGSATVRRSMNGIIPSIATNRFEPGVGGIPPGGGAGEDELTEPVLNAALRQIWEQSSGSIDTILVAGAQKRRINSFIGASRAYGPADTRVRDQVGVYESDFGVCRVVLSRWAPPGMVLLLDSSRIEVPPLRGRSFHFKPLGAAGDSVSGLVVGEYTLEFRNESAHGLIKGLATSSSE